MSRPVGTPLTEEEVKAAVAAYLEHEKNATAAAEALGIPRTSFRRRITVAAEYGLLGTDPVLPGYHIKSISQQTGPDGDLEKEWVKQVKEPGELYGTEEVIPPGQIIKGVSTLIDAEGRIVQQWVKTKADPYSAEWTTEVIQAAFKDYEGRAAPILPPIFSDTDYLNLIPCNDWHINMLAWWREVGESWDLKLAERAIGEAMEVVISSARRAGTAVILGGGDLMHNDDNTNRTAKSAAVLDADGRWQKGMEVTLRLMVRTIEIALAYNNKVIVRILKGNHDEQSSVAIAYFLYAWFRNEPRVEVDLDASLFWWYRFGKVLLGATHGHTVKIEKMPQIMANRRPEDWGVTKYRYVHGFHIHHKEVIAKEDGGVICETHQAPIPQDSWHYGSGYLSGRSVQIITYHKDLGEYGRRREPIPDAMVSKPVDFLKAA